MFDRLVWLGVSCAVCVGFRRCFCDMTLRLGVTAFLSAKVDEQLAAMQAVRGGGVSSGASGGVIQGGRHVGLAPFFCSPGIGVCFNPDVVEQICSLATVSLRWGVGDMRAADDGGMRGFNGVVVWMREGEYMKGVVSGAARGGGVDLVPSRLVCSVTDFEETFRVVGDAGYTFQNPVYVCWDVWCALGDEGLGRLCLPTSRKRGVVSVGELAASCGLPGATQLLWALTGVVDACCELVLPGDCFQVRCGAVVQLTALARCRVLSKGDYATLELTAAGREPFFLKVHRFKCWLRRGPVANDLLVVHHVCENKMCCNPSHLRWFTQRENASDAPLLERRQQAVGSRQRDSKGRFLPRGA